MTTGKASVFVAGDITFNSLIYLDSFPEPKPQTVFSTGFNETVGGTAAGKALNLNRLGMAVTLHGLIGDDAPGQKIREVFAREKLALIVDIDPKGTPRHVNLMAKDGGRISIYVQYATFEPEIDLDRLDQQIAQSDYVALNLSNYCRRLIPLAKAHNKPIWCDIHDYDGINEYHRDFIAGADVITMSSDAMPDYKPFMQRLIADGKRFVVCTHGRAGATALTPDGEWITVPALTTYEQRDTNGAGDSFFAGLLYGYEQGYAIERCLRLGAITAGLCVTSQELFDPDLSVDRIAAEYARIFGVAG
ncbi:MAG: carbohydrate kinase family protein [Anaerolineae bacterium]|nr:carbohydrate kinase family protein [Anaerolineae bacterium]